MKRAIVSIAFVLLLSTLVFAHSTDDLELTELGIKNVDRVFSNPSTPADSAFYGFKRFGESLASFFAFDNSQKINLHRNFLVERLKEANDLIKKDKKADSLLADYTKEATIISDLIESSRDLERLEKISSTSERALILLLLIREKVGNNFIVSNSINKTVELEAVSDFVLENIQKNISTEDINDRLNKKRNELFQEELEEYKDLEKFVKDYYIKNLENELEKINDKIRETNDTEILQKEKQDIIQKINSAKVSELHCIVAGCSSELCISSEEFEESGGFSTCVYKPEYACLKYSNCQMLDDGCGWTQTDDYLSCLSSLEN